MADIQDYSKRRFLIVDDEPFMLGVIERMLRQHKAAETHKASDGGSALRSIAQHSQVDCIISDFNMKPINGLQLLQAVRMGVNPHIPRHQPFIMLTGHGETEVVRMAIDLDVSGYLVKPVAPDKLALTLDHVFKKNIDLKDPAHYRAVHIGSARHLNDAVIRSGDA